MMKKVDDRRKIEILDEVMKNMVGVMVPYNLIVQCFSPIQKWINKELRGDEDDFGEGDAGS